MYKIGINDDGEREAYETANEVLKNIKNEIETSKYASCEFVNKPYDINDNNIIKKVIYIENLNDTKSGPYSLVIMKKNNYVALYRIYYGIDLYGYKVINTNFYTDGIKDISVQEENKLFKITAIAGDEKTNKEYIEYVCQFKKEEE